MAKWSFWDWLTYACIGAAAFVLAVDQAIKGSPTLLERFSGLLSQSSWSYAPLSLIGLSAVLLLFQTIRGLGTRHPIDEPHGNAEKAQVQYVQTSVRLQFFGDHRIPQEVSTENVACWFAYFSASLSITPTDAQGNVIPGGLQIPSNWVVFITFDRPTKYRQAIVSFSNEQQMPITDTHMANDRVVVVSTRGQVPAGVLTITFAT